jgi:tRNA modification GTPase
MCITSLLPSQRIQAADVSLLVLAYPDAVSSVTPSESGSRLDIPADLAPLVTQNTFILLNKTDLLPTSAPALEEALTTTCALPQHQQRWAVSLATNAGTGDFLSGLATALQDRYGLSAFLSYLFYSFLL